MMVHELQSIRCFQTKALIELDKPSNKMAAFLQKLDKKVAFNLNNSLG